METTPTKKAAQLFSIVLAADVHMKTAMAKYLCTQICKLHIATAYKIDMRYYKEYLTFWNKVQAEVNKH